MSYYIYIKKWNILLIICFKNYNYQSKMRFDTLIKGFLSLILFKLILIIIYSVTIQIKSDYYWIFAFLKWDLLFYLAIIWTSSLLELLIWLLHWKLLTFQEIKGIFRYYIIDININYYSKNYMIDTFHYI